jgi:ABC-type transport system substrate-binding protein
MDGIVWVGAQDAGEVDAIDANTGRVTAYKFGHEVTTATAGGGTVMIGVNPSPDEILAAVHGKVLRVASPPDFLQGPDPDPGSVANPYKRMMLYATCSRLLDYGDAAGPDSYDLRPEVAAGMPEVSADGLTYTFTIKPGFGFSPPSTEKITAETYRYSIERSLSPVFDVNYMRGIDFLDDIAGAQAFHDGTADHVTGLQAQDDKLVVTLTKPSATFLARLTLPFSCPVPTRTPIAAGLDPSPPIPSSGPYYLAAHGGGEYAVLERNPNYGGSRTGAYDAFTFRFGLDNGATVQWVDDGRADIAVGDAALQSGQDLSNLWGPGSDNATQGRQRWYGIFYPGIDFLIVNPASKFLADADARRAVALALDRAAIAESYSEIPATSVLNDSFQVRDAAIPEIIGPDATGAATLLGGRTGTIRFVSFADCQPCLDIANTIKSSLAGAGITMEIVEDQNPIEFAADPKNNIDMLENYAQPWFPDSATLLEQIGSVTPQNWISEAQASRMQAVLAMTGDARDQAAASFAHDLASDGLLIPWGYPVEGVYFGDPVGCRTLNSGIMNLDLVALCPQAP